jgi:hypothetical protein
MSQTHSDSPPQRFDAVPDNGIGSIALVPDFFVRKAELSEAATPARPQHTFT